MKHLVLLISLVFASVACTKENNKNYDDENETEIQDYLKANNLNAQKTDSGLYYIIDSVGTGLQPTRSDNVIVSYTGKFTNGKVFDKSTEFGYAFNLNSIIYGMSEGISMMKEGGESTLIIPSRLGYGNSEWGAIPAGSVLIFDVKLISTEAGLDSINDQQIKKYLNENNLVANKSKSGIYYIIDKVGEGEKPNPNSNVVVKYKGYFLNKEIFGESKLEDGDSFNLQDVIPGFQEGLTYLNEGGSGTILIPANLAYKFSGNRNIPAGAVIVFDLELLKVD
jgi:FKBP-type peptidyl-prolyl cis-trans isomerase